MKKKKELRKQVIIVSIGVIILLAVAIFCYRYVGNTIIKNEQVGLKSLAKVNAQSLQSSLEAKSNLIYAVFSGDMRDVEDIETGVLKLGEKGKYIQVDEVEATEQWEQSICEQAAKNPREVVVGPVRKSEEEYYVLYLTKAVYIEGKLAGYVEIELNLDEIYAGEQALFNLQVENSRYCIVKMGDTTIMPSDYADANISLSQMTGNGCTIEWVYETEKGIPTRTQKLIAYETLTIGTEEFILCIIEDYDQVLKPIEQIALFFFLIAMIILICTVGFMHKLSEQQKKEALLVNELQHEKTLNETMKKQEGMMQKYNHSKTMSVLTGSIAHEFNNLMTPIVLYTELLEENEMIKEEMPEEIAELKSATLRCEELARQLLSYSRQGKAEKVLTDYDATYAMREAVSIVEKLIPSHIVLKTTICKTPYFIHGQVGTLNQIILNLTTNAIHAMKAGGTLKISFGLSTDNEKYVRLVVEDTGTGIPREIQQKVFHPFFTTKPVGEGTGIGLTVVKRLTEEHGGIIRAQSIEGKGTTFILDFPRVM